MRWAEASRLEQSDFKNFKFYPLKLDLHHSGLVLLVLVLVSWFSGTSQKLGFHFPEALATEKVRSRCQ
jgi:hypothetical protein